MLLQPVENIAHSLCSCAKPSNPFCVLPGFLSFGLHRPDRAAQDATLTHCDNTHIDSRVELPLPEPPPESPLQYSLRLSSHWPQ